MILKRYDISVDLTNGVNYMQLKKYSQGDSGTSVLGVSLTNRYIPVSISGQSIVFNFKRADGSTLSQDMVNGSKGVTIMDATAGTFQCILDPQVLMIPGEVQCQAVLSTGGNIISTAIFSFTVDESIGLLRLGYIASINNQLITWRGEVDALIADGVRGLTGDTGAQGPRGLQGVQGDQGVPGATFNNTANEAALTVLNTGLANNATQVGKNIIASYENNLARNNQKNAYTNSGYLLDSFQLANGRTLSNCTATVDTINYKIGNGAVKFTSSAVSVTSAETMPLSVDLSDMTSIELILYLDVLKKPTFGNISFIDNNGYILGASIASGGFVNGWNVVRIKKSVMTNDYGTPNLANIKNVKFRFDSPAGYQAEITLAKLSKNAVGRSCFIFTFDDCFSSAYDLAYPIFASRNIKGSLGVVGTWMNLANHMTTTQVQTMYNDGWDILNHSYTHPDLSTLSYEGVYSEVVKNINYLNSVGVTKYNDVFIYPVGTNAGNTVLKDVGIKYARTATQSVNVEPIQDLLNLTILTLEKNTLATMQARIDDAILFGTPVIFLIHYVDDAPTTTALHTDKQTLADIADYLIANNAPIMTLGEYCHSIYTE